MHSSGPDSITDTLVMTFLELIHERRLRGKPYLAATLDTTAQWLRERSGLSVEPRHVQVMASALEQAGIISIGGGGIGKPNTYASCEDDMGPEQFWNQVDAFLLVWRHPSRKRLAEGLGG